MSPSSHSSLADSSVEWAYAFDVHTNSFFPCYLTLYVAQLILLPIITKDKWVCLLVGNTLYLAGYVPLLTRVRTLTLLLDLRSTFTGCTSG